MIGVTPDITAVDVMRHGVLGLTFAGNGEIAADTGIGHRSDGVLGLVTNGGERMTILASGNVGISNANPQQELSERIRPSDHR